MSGYNFYGESFDHYTGASSGAFPLSTLYTSNIDGGAAAGTPSLIGGRFGGQAMRLSLQTNTGSGIPGFFMNRPLDRGPATQIGKSFAFRRSLYNLATVGSGVPIWRARNASGIQFMVGVNSDGFLVVGRTNFTTELLGTSSDHMPLYNDPWHTIDIETEIGSAVAFALKLNGTTRLTLPSVNTQAQAAATMTSEDYCVHVFTPNNTLVTVDFDDAYLRDDGIVFDEPGKSEPLYPVSDAGTNQWTPSSGTDHFAMIDEPLPDGDTTYLSDHTPGHKDLVGLSNLSTTPSKIFGAQTVTLAHKTDAGLVEIRSNLVSGSTTENGHDQTLGLNIGVEFDWNELDPDTGLAWNTSGINALDVEVELITA